MKGVSVCMDGSKSIFSTIDFTLGRCIGNGLRKCSVYWEVLWEQ